MRKKLTEELKKAAVEAYEKTGNLTVVAQIVGVSRGTLAAEANRSGRFRIALDNAKAVYCELLEDVLDKRIRNPDSTDKASALLLMFKLKAEMPEKYREYIEHKVDTRIEVRTAIPRPPAMQEVKSGQIVEPSGVLGSPQT